MTLLQRIEGGKNFFSRQMARLVGRRPYPVSMSIPQVDYFTTPMEERQRHPYEAKRYDYSYPEFEAMMKVQSLLTPLAQGFAYGVKDREGVMYAALQFGNEVIQFRQKGWDPLSMIDIEIPGDEVIAKQIVNALVDPKAKPQYFYETRRLLGKGAHSAFIQPVNGAEGLYIVGSQYVKHPTNPYFKYDPNDFEWVYRLVGEETNRRQEEYWG